MKRIIGIVALVAVLVLSLVACGKQDSDKQGESKKDGKINITTTVYPLQSFAEQIGGKHVNVSSMYPAGTDLHDYEPTQKDMLKANKSDLFIYTGDDLDPVAKKVASTIKKDDNKLSLQKGLDKSDLLANHHEHGEEHEHGEDHEHGEEHEHHHHGAYDPHVWLDPKKDEVFAKEIKNQLVKKDPDHKADYEKNYKKLVKDLNNIDSKMKDITKGKQGNAVFISHESLGYLADRYGFVQKGIQNMNAEDPSQKELTQLVKEIKENNVKYILYEDNVSNKVTETLRKDTDAEALKFYNMESLSKDQMKDDSLSYQKLMDKNIEVLEKALNTNTKIKDSESE